MSTTGHENEAIKVSGLKKNEKKLVNLLPFNEVVCSTAAATAAKVSNTTPTSFNLVTKAEILVKFTYGITVANATFKVGSTDAKPIYYKGAALPSGLVKAGTTVLMRYDGTNYNILGELGDDKYEKPSTGIPSTDLASDVQTSLGKADSALQAIQAQAGDNISSVGTPSVTASTSGTTTTLTFNYLKGATGSNGSNGTSAYWFSGTAVTGTGTNISVTVSGSKAGDMYLNTSTSNVYKATAANKWDYICNIKGANGSNGTNGAAAGFGTPTATIDANVGTPSVTVTASGADTSKVFAFDFKNLKGQPGSNGTNGTRGSLIYWGTAITGTSTTPTIFSGSGISSALVNDMYINTSTYNVYQCTTAGAASAAKWKYIGCIKGATGTTPTLTAAAGTNIGSVGTPSVTASTSGTETTFTFNYLKGAKGDPGQNATTTSVFSGSANGLAPAASNGNKTTAESSASKYYLCDDAKYRQLPANAFKDTNTKNTAGTTSKTGKKMFLVGAESQSASPQTYSNDNCYIGTDNCLYSNGTKVLTSHQDISGKADKSATVSTVAYDTTNKKITKTINGTTSDVVTASTIVTDGLKIQQVSGKSYYELTW